MSWLERAGLICITSVSLALGGLLLLLARDGTATAIEGCAPPRATTVETLETVEQAEKLVCFEIPHPRRLGSWRFTDVAARVYGGTDDRIAALRYLSDLPGASFSFAVTLSTDPQSNDPVLDRLTTCVVVMRWRGCLHASQQLGYVPLRGTVAVVRYGGGRGANAIDVRWREDDLTFIAQGILTQHFDLEDLLRILHSIS